MGWFDALSGMMKQASSDTETGGTDTDWRQRPIVDAPEGGISNAWNYSSILANSPTKKKNTGEQIKGWMDTAFPAYQEQFNKTLADYDNWSGDAETAKRSTNSQMSQFLAQTGQGGQSNSAQMMARIAGALQNAKLEEARRTLQMDKLNLMRQNFGELFGYASSLADKWGRSILEF